MASTESKDATLYLKYAVQIHISNQYFLNLIIYLADQSDLC